MAHAVSTLPFTTEFQVKLRRTGVISGWVTTWVYVDLRPSQFSHWLQVRMISPLSFPFLSFHFLSFPFLSFPFLSFPFLSMHILGTDHRAAASEQVAHLHAD